MTEVASPRDRFQVVVLMATFNGRRWVDEQVDSILDQVGVDVRLVVSDDGSSDGTREHLLARSEADPRLRVLPRRAGPPGVTANFLHLFTTVPVDGQEYVAFSDQDDVWHTDKLFREIELLRSTEADVVSTNVMSFDGTGKRNLVVKSRPQRRWDYVFEAAGPGSTYVFTGSAHARLCTIMGGMDLNEVGVHDWFLYALLRAAGGRWLIDAQPTLDYRQHGDNVQGEHAGVAAFCSRLGNLRSGFYRRQFLLTARTARRVGGDHHDVAWRHELDALIADLEDTGLRGRIGIARRFREIRRDPKEGLELAVACLAGIW